jgi:hypothetical protein
MEEEEEEEEEEVHLVGFHYKNTQYRTLYILLLDSFILC